MHAIVFSASDSVIAQVYWSRVLDANLELIYTYTAVLLNFPVSTYKI